MWWKVILGLLAVWLVITVAGALLSAIIKGLFWLAVIGGAAFLVTAAIGWVKKDRKELR